MIIQVMQQRRENSPRSIQLIITDEVGVVTLQCVKDQRLVGLGDLEVGEATAVGEIELGNDGLHGETGELGVHLDVDRLVGLDTDDQFVAGDVLEDTGCDVTELNADLSLLFVEGWMLEVSLVIDLTQT